MKNQHQPHLIYVHTNLDRLDIPMVADMHHGFPFAILVEKKLRIPRNKQSVLDTYLQKCIKNKKG